MTSWSSFAQLLLLFIMFWHCAHSLVMHPQLRRNDNQLPLPSSPANSEEQHQPHQTESTRRWYGEDAKEMLRDLEEVTRERKRQEAERRARIRAEGSLFDKFMSLFTEKPDDEGPKHDCFFSAFNCPVNPARNIPGVRRIRITAEEHKQLLEKQRQKKGRKGHKRRRYRHNL